MATVIIHLYQATLLNLLASEYPIDVKVTTSFGKDLPPILIQVSKSLSKSHDDVIKWKHFSRYWHFVQGIHRSPAYSPHKAQWFE